MTHAQSRRGRGAHDGHRRWLHAGRSAPTASDRSRRALRSTVPRHDTRSSRRRWPRATVRRMEHSPKIRRSPGPRCSPADRKPRHTATNDRCSAITWMASLGRPEWEPNAQALLVVLGAGRIAAAACAELLRRRARNPLLALFVLFMPGMLSSLSTLTAEPIALRVSHDRFAPLVGRSPAGGARRDLLLAGGLEPGDVHWSRSRHYAVAGADAASRVANVGCGFDVWHRWPRRSLCVRGLAHAAPRAIGRRGRSPTRGALVSDTVRRSRARHVVVYRSRGLRGSGSRQRWCSWCSQSSSTPTR